MNKLCLVKADLFCDVFDKNKNNPGKRFFLKITWYTHFKCKQRMMYLIYVLNNLSRSLSLSLSLSHLFLSLLYISGPTVVYLLCIHLASTIIILICSPIVLLSTKTTKATFLFIVLLLYVVVKIFSVSYNTCSCKLPIKVFFQPTV